MNKIEMTIERISKYTFSFLGRKAIQEILIELKIIKITATMKKELLRNDRLSS
jgi:hypothetical protein